MKYSAHRGERASCPVSRCADHHGSIQPAGDRRTGVSAAQAAANATDNVISIGLDKQTLADLAVNFVESASGSATNRLREFIRDRVDWVEAEHFDQGHYVPHATILKDVDHRSYIKHLLSPSANGLILTQVSLSLLSKSIDQHADDLDHLRKDRPELYSLIIRGKIGKALCRACRADTFVFKVLSNIAYTHTCLFMIRTAYRKLEAVRDLSTQPYGTHFSGRNRWPLMGSTFLETVAAPALVIQRLMKINDTTDTADLDDKGVFQLLVDNAILPNTKAGRLILEAGQVARDLIKLCPRKRGAMNLGVIPLTHPPGSGI